MATKKSKVDNGDLKFDSDLDFNFDDSFDIVNTSKSKKKRKPIHDVVRGAKDATKSKLKSGSFWNNVARKALPRSYGVLVEETLKSREVLSDSYRDTVRTLKPDLARIGRQVDALVPEESKRIKKWTSKFKDKSFDASNVSAEGLNNQAISQAQAEIFGKLQSHTDAKEARDRSEQRVRDKMDSKRFSASTNILGVIADGMSRVSSYTTTVNASFQKKSLELQYRSYFTQAEMLKNSVKYNDLFKSYFEAIKENTALPDFAKITKTEKFKELALNKAFSGFQSGIAAGVKRVTKRVGDYARGAADRLGDISMGLDQAGVLKDQLQMARELGMDESAMYHGSNTAGGLLIDMLVDKYGPKMRKFFPHTGRVSKLVSGAARVARDPTHLINSWQNREGYKKAQDKEGMWGDLARMGNAGLNLFKTPELDRNLTKSQGVNAGIQPHYFSGKAHRSLTEVIPGYLARILQETTAIRTGNRQIGDLAVFDYSRGRFTTAKSSMTKAENSLLKAANTGLMDYKLHEVAKGLTGQAVSGDQAKRIKQFLHIASTDVKMNYASNDIFNNPSFQNLPAEDQALLRKQITKLHGTEQGKTFMTDAMIHLREGAGNQVASAMKVLHGLINDGHTEELVKKGLIRSNKDGGYSINLPRVYSLIRGKGITKAGIKPEEVKRWFIPRGEDEPRMSNANNNTEDFDSIITDLDRNVKSNIKGNKSFSVLDKLKNPGSYRYNYKKSFTRNDGARHQGYMAQEVNKTFGDQAAPDGVKVDMSYMTSMNTEAIKELHKKNMEGPGIIAYLASIDRRLAELSTLGKVQSGISPESGDSKNLFGATTNLASRYIRAIVGRGSRAARKVVGAGANGAMGAASIGKGLIDRHKGTVGAAGNRIISDVFSLLGVAYNTGREVVTNLIPRALTSATNIVKGIANKTKDFLSQPRDFYIPGLKEPIILGDLFKKGFYVDEHGNPILTVNDLKKVSGNVYNRAGDVVVTATQMAHGLFDKYGNKLDYLITSLKDIVVGTAGWVGGRIAHGMGRLKNLFTQQGKGEGKGNIISRTLGGIGGGLGSLFGGIGGGGKTQSTLDAILKILKKWDGHGIGGGMGPAMSEPAMGGSSMGDFMGPPAPGSSNVGSGGFATLGAAKNAIGGIFSRYRNARARQKEFVGPPAPGRAPGRFGRLFGGRLGKLGGRFGGLLSAAGSMFSGGQAQAEGPHNEFMGPPAPNQQTKKSGLFSRLTSRMSRIPANMRAWNDPNGTGRRAGDWRTREEEMAERDANKQQSGPGAAPEAKYQNAGGGILGGLAGLLSNGFGDVFKLAKGTFGALSKVGKGIFSLVKGPLRLGGVAGKLGRVGGGVLGKVGSPIAKGLEKIGVGKILQKVGIRGMMGFAARNAGKSVLLGAADFLLTGGLGTTLVAGIGMGLSALGAIVSSPVVLGGLAVAGAAYGGYKLFKYVTRDKTDEFQKFRYMQYGFGPAQGEQYNHRLTSLEQYLLDGRVGYQAQAGSTNKVAYLLDKKVDPAMLLKVFDVSAQDPEEVQMFTSWMQYRFKPFFLNTLTALYSANPKVKLPDAAGKLSGEERVKFLNGAKFSSCAGYGYTQPPVKGLDSLGSYQTEVANQIDALIKSSDKKGKADGKDGKGKKSLLDRAKDIASFAIPGYGAFKLGKSALTALGNTKIGGAVKDMASAAVTSASTTGKKLLKYLSDKKIPSALKQTVLGFGSSIMASVPKLGDKLMAAAMVSMAPVAGAAYLGAKALLKTKTGQKIKSAASNAFSAVSSAVSNVYQKAKDFAAPVTNALGNAYSAGKSAYEKAVDYTSRGFDKAKEFISKNYDKMLGFISSKYESGRRGVGTISSGAGDAGGVSYGRFQLSSKSGTMAAFLSSPEGQKYAAQFQGARIASPAFNAKYKEISDLDTEGFDKAQHDFITRTHYEVAYKKLDGSVPELNLSKRGRAVKEAIFSTAVQYGPTSSVLVSALKGQDVSKMSDEAVVNAIQKYKSETIDSRFRSSSPAVRQSIASRIANENMDLTALARQTSGGKSNNSTAEEIANKLAVASGTIMAPGAANNSLSANKNGQYTIDAGSSTSGMTSTATSPNTASSTTSTSTSVTVEKTALNPAAGDAASSAGSSSAPKRQNFMTPPAPAFTSTNTSSARVDSGDSSSMQLISIASDGLNIHKKQLDTMIEIRDMIQGFVSIYNAKQQASGNSKAMPPMKTEMMKPLVDIRRTRA